ncbi:unnamed protein product [Nezara viridula]|uniref:Uncharacterized protein n=1 Tax=Nezara viridula TaxID=85310 RepID=A0A9P0DVJ5_NEZVI|nr:unnamed protein product [Nezara viridula]
MLSWKKSKEDGWMEWQQILDCFLKTEIEQLQHKCTQSILNLQE